jgi:hypothetical protein
MSVQWHTEPIRKQEEVKQVRPLDQLLKGSGPFYARLQRRLESGGLTKDERDWLETIRSNFDSTASKLMYDTDFKPWSEIPNLIIQYEFAYPDGDSPTSCYQLMGRLLTLNDIEDALLQRSAQNSPLQAIWRGPPPPSRPLEGDCFGNTNYLEHRAWPVSGINPKDPSRLYEVALQKPWRVRDAKSSQHDLGLDPVHHWGVYETSPDQFYMACCGERVGQTEGCWMNITRSTVQRIKPYRVMPYSPWKRLLSGGSFLSHSEVDRAPEPGTAFQHPDRYSDLHNQILEQWRKLSPYLSTHLRLYGLWIQEGRFFAEDLPASFYYKLSPNGRAIAATVMSLVNDYNRIQCVQSSLAVDFVNEEIYHLKDAVRLIQQKRNTYRTGLGDDTLGLLDDEEPLYTNDIDREQEKFDNIRSGIATATLALLQAIRLDAVQLSDVAGETDETEEFLYIANEISRAKRDYNSFVEKGRFEAALRSGEESSVPRGPQITQDDWVRLERKVREIAEEERRKEEKRRDTGGGGGGTGAPQGRHGGNDGDRQGGGTGAPQGRHGGSDGDRQGGGDRHGGSEGNRQGEEERAQGRAMLEERRLEEVRLAKQRELDVQQEERRREEDIHRDDARKEKRRLERQREEEAEERALRELQLEDQQERRARLLETLANVNADTRAPRNVDEPDFVADTGLQIPLKSSDMDGRASELDAIELGKQRLLRDARDLPAGEMDRLRALMSQNLQSDFDRARASRNSQGQLLYKKWLHLVAADNDAKKHGVHLGLEFLDAVVLDNQLTPAKWEEIQTQYLEMLDEAVTVWFTTALPLEMAKSQIPEEWGIIVPDDARTSDVRRQGLERAIEAWNDLTLNPIEREKIVVQGLTRADVLRK